MPAARKTDVGAPGASLQEPLGVVRIVDQSMIGLPDLPSRLEGVGKGFNRSDRYAEAIGRRASQQSAV